MKEKGISLSNLMKRLVQEFGKSTSINAFLDTIGNLEEAGSNCCQDSQQYCKIILAQLLAGNMFIYTNGNMPLGTLLRNFVNLTNTMTFDQENRLLSLSGLNWCSKLNK